MRTTAVSFPLVSVFMALTAAVVSCGAIRGESFLVKDGQARAEIIIAEQCPPIVRVAAGDLQKYVALISGAKLPIITAPSGKTPVRIYVGRSAQTDHLNIPVDDLNHGAYRMVSGRDWLALVGRARRWQPKGLMMLATDRSAWTVPGKRRAINYDHPLWKGWDKRTGEHWGLPFSQLWKQHNTEMDLWGFDERGPYNAVAGFLRMQGVRWYMPGDLGEVVPKKATIALPKIDKTVRPDFAVRYPYLYGKRFGQTGKGTDYLMWQLRMGFNLAVDVLGPGYRAHGIAHVIGRDEVKNVHPEYYALIGGRRVTHDRWARHGRPCLSSKALIAKNAEFVRAMFDTFDMPMVSVMPVDGFTSICKCELCEGKHTPERGWRGQFSDYVWEYCDKVAREVYKTHPDRKVVGHAYSTYLLPPTRIKKMSPNMVVSICQHRAGLTQNPAERAFIQDLRRQWLEKLPGKGKRLYQYDYYRYAVPGKSYEYMPAFFPRAIAWDLRQLKDISFGEYTEVHTGDAPVVTGLNVYVTGRYWWDADQDIDALLEEFYTLFYGPARNEMKAFIEYSEQNWADMKNVEKIERVFSLLAAAQAKAPEGSLYAKRIALTAGYIKPLKDLAAQLSRPRDNVPRAVLVTLDDAKIKIDGKLDEPAWQKLRTYSLRDLKTGRAERNARTRFHIFWAKDALYMGIVCREPEMEGLNITAKTHDDTSIWSGDEVEVLIETQVHSYYQLCVSPSGALVDIDHKNKMRTIWSSNADVAVSQGGDRAWVDEAWTVEMRIPVADEAQANIDPNNGLAGRKPSNAYPWYFNVCRQRVRGQTQQHWAFSPTGRGFQVPRKFAEMGGILRDIKRLDKMVKDKAK